MLLALSIYPLLYSITDQSEQFGKAWSLGNFTRLLSDNFFLTAMAHTFVYAGAALTCEFLLGLGLALLLDKQMRGRGLFRAGLLVPMMLPPVVAGSRLATDAQSKLRRDQRHAQTDRHQH